MNTSSEGLASLEEKLPPERRDVYLIRRLNGVFSAARSAGQDLELDELLLNVCACFEPLPGCSPGHELVISAKSVTSIHDAVFALLNEIESLQPETNSDFNRRPDTYDAIAKLAKQAADILTVDLNNQIFDSNLGARSHQRNMSADHVRDIMTGTVHRAPSHAEVVMESAYRIALGFAIGVFAARSPHQFQFDKGTVEETAAGFNYMATLYSGRLTVTHHLGKAKGSASKREQDTIRAQAYRLRMIDGLVTRESLASQKSFPAIFDRLNLIKKALLHAFDQQGCAPKR